MKSASPRESAPRAAGIDLALRWCVVLAVPAALAALFVWCGGWLSPRLSAPRIVSAFEARTAPHPGFRRNHAKGICVAGYFDSNGAGQALSRASVFGRGRYPFVGRFSMPGGDPGADDSTAAVRSLALRIALPHGEDWRLAMNSVPIFPARTPQALFDQLTANPAKMQAFFDTHPDARAFNRFLDEHPPSSGFDNATYYGISTFSMTDAYRVQRFVRWDVTPDHPYRAVESREQRDPDFLSYDLLTQLASGPLRWHLMLNVALPGDPLDDSTRQWANSPRRQRIDAGTVVVESARTQIDGPCRDIVFDPTILPDGIAPSADPLLAARSSTYRVSFDRRSQEEAAARANEH